MCFYKKGQINSTLRTPHSSKSTVIKRQDDDDDDGDGGDGEDDGYGGDGEGEGDGQGGEGGEGGEAGESGEGEGDGQQGMPPPGMVPVYGGGSLPASIFDNVPLQMPGGDSQGSMQPVMSPVMGPPMPGGGGGGGGGGGEDSGGAVADDPTEISDNEPSRPRQRPRGPIGRAVNNARKFRVRTNEFVQDVRKRFVDWLDGYSADGQDENGEESNETEEEKRRKMVV